jgi:hypothetical protein
MTTRVSCLCVFVGLLVFMTLGARRLYAPAEFQSKAGSSESAQTPESQQSVTPATGKETFRELFRQHCLNSTALRWTG